MLTAEHLTVLYPVVQLFTVISLVIGVYVALKREVRRESSEVKKHTDVSVRKLNGLNVDSLIHSMDRPAWLKVATIEDGRTEFRMLTINRHYERAFGITSEQYIGRTDAQAGWDPQTVAKFYDHDLYIWQTGQPATVVEVCFGVPYRFRKIRVCTPDGVPKGIMGFTVDDVAPPGKHHINTLPSRHILPGLLPDPIPDLDLYPDRLR